jgi:Family of unknown function (DUF5343)
MSFARYITLGFINTPHQGGKMALPTSYLTSIKNLEGVFAAMQSAQAPEKFTQAFLESLEFKSNSDRLVIGVLKSIGFLDDSGRPTDRYFRFLDQTQAPKVLAEGVRDGYQDLFKVNTKAHELNKQDVMNKFKTLGQGQISESVLDKMAMTFTALAKLGDFQSPATAVPPPQIENRTVDEAPEKPLPHAGIKLGGLVYNIQIVLPESRDAAVYDALFQSLRKHLL